VLENDGLGLNLTWEVRDGIARHSKGKSGMPVGADPDHRASTIEAIARVADIIAYVNHDIDDATRAGLLRTKICRASASRCSAARRRASAAW
jgi:dGTPase